MLIKFFSIVNLSNAFPLTILRTTFFTIFDGVVLSLLLFVLLGSLFFAGVEISSVERLFLFGRRCRISLVPFSEVDPVGLPASVFDVVTGIPSGGIRDVRFLFQSVIL